MENYLLYLDKLQKEMNLEYEVNHDKLEEYRKLRSRYNNLASLFGFIGIALALSMVFVAHYSRIGALVVLVMTFGSMSFVTEFDDKSKSYGELVRNERDKVYNLNYSNIKNIIVNDGDEHMKQLATWWRMCELSDKDREEYAELLRIVGDICREYVILWR